MEKIIDLKEFGIEKPWKIKKLGYLTRQKLLGESIKTEIQFVQGQPKNKSDVDYTLFNEKLLIHSIVEGPVDNWNTYTYKQKYDILDKQKDEVIEKVLKEVFELNLYNKILTEETKKK